MGRHYQPIYQFIESTPFCKELEPLLHLGVLRETLDGRTHAGPLFLLLLLVINAVEEEHGSRLLGHRMLPDPGGIGEEHPTVSRSQQGALKGEVPQEIFRELRAPPTATNRSLTLVRRKGAA